MGESNPIEHIDNRTAMNIADALLWAQPNLYRVFTSGNVIYIWKDTDVHNARSFSTLQAATAYIDGLRSCGYAWKKENEKGNSSL